MRLIREQVLLELCTLFIALVIVDVLAEREINVQQKIPNLIDRSNGTHSENSSSPTANINHKNSEKDPLLILWIILGIGGFLAMSFVICYCLFKYCDGGEDKESPEPRPGAEQTGNKPLDVEVLQTLQEEGQVIEFLQMLEESSRKSLERNLSPSRMEEFGSANELYGSEHKGVHILPQKVVEGTDGTYVPRPPPYDNLHTQPHSETTSYNYGFADEEDSFPPGTPGYYGDEDVGQHRHRALWYEDSVNDSNDNTVFPASRSNQSCVDQNKEAKEQHSEQEQVYNHNVTMATDGTKVDIEHEQPANADCSEIHHDKAKDSVVEKVVIKSQPYIGQDKENVTYSLSGARRYSLKQELEKLADDSQDFMIKSKRIKLNDLDELDDVEYGVSGYNYASKSSAIHETFRPKAVKLPNDDEGRIYNEVLKGSIAALAIANGVTDVSLGNGDLQHAKKIAVKESETLLERGKKKSFKSKEYGSLINEPAGPRKDFHRHSVLKRINNKRKDSRQKFKESGIGKQTRKLSRKVVKGLSKVKSKAKGSSSKKTPDFVVASL